MSKSPANSRFFVKFSCHYGYYATSHLHPGPGRLSRCQPRHGAGHDASPASPRCAAARHGDPQGGVDFDRKSGGGVRWLGGGFSYTQGWSGGMDMREWECGKEGRVKKVGRG